MSATDGLAQVNTLATHTALTVWSGASDFLIVLILFSVFFLFAWYVGRGPLVAVLLALYAAYALYATFPYMSYLPTAPALTALLAHIGLYFGLTLAFYIILRRVVVSDFLYIGIFGLIALSFLGAGFLLALAYHVFPVASVYTFTPAVNILFAPKAYFFWWFVAPAIGLSFLAR
jgi:VanZ family protein